MGRLLLGTLFLAWALPLSFACQSSEEIYGYELGCPLTSTTAVKGFSHDERHQEYTDTSHNQWFDKVSIETVDGKIGRLVFIKKYTNQHAVNGEVPKILKSLQRKWGGTMGQDFVSKLYNYTTRVNTSDILHTIVGQDKGRDPLTYEVYFLSKDYVEYYKDVMIRRISASLQFQHEKGAL